MLHGIAVLSQLDRVDVSEYSSSMQLNIKNPEAHRLARELAGLTGETMSGAVTQALQERLERERRRRGREGVSQKLLLIGQRASKRRVLDTRSPNEILGYDESGLPR